MVLHLKKMKSLKSIYQLCFFLCIKSPYPSNGEGKRKIRFKRLFYMGASCVYSLEKLFLDLLWLSDGRLATTIILYFLVHVIKSRAS